MFHCAQALGLLGDPRVVDLLCAELTAENPPLAQLAAAASALGVHRHTLRGRIERVEDMLAVDLSDARTRAELLLTLLSESA